MATPDRRTESRARHASAQNNETDMVDSGTALSQHRFDVRATAGSHFAWLRTRLSLERTMMAWVRTAITLIGFGFTIVQFFERLPQLTGAEPLRQPAAPFYFGLLLIGAGIVALVISGWQYRTVIAYLRQGEFAAVAGIPRGPTHTPIYAITIITIFIGVFAFLTVATRAL
jgi:putative membrane protein